MASGVEKGDRGDLVGRKSKELWTKDVPSSWFSIDLGPNRRVIPSHYTLQHGGSYKSDCLRNWDFQGSLIFIFIFVFVFVFVFIFVFVFFFFFLFLFLFFFVHLLKNQVLRMETPGNQLEDTPWTNHSMAHSQPILGLWTVVIKYFFFFAFFFFFFAFFFF